MPTARGRPWPKRLLGWCWQPELTLRPVPQLRPLFLLALADFLAAGTLLSTAAIQLLPAPLFIPAYAACPYGRMLATVRGPLAPRGWGPPPTPPRTAGTRLWAGASPGKPWGGKLFLLV